MSTSFISDTDLPCELNSETPIRSLHYAKRENAQISEENEIYIAQIRSLKEQLEKVLDINKNYDSKITEIEQLNKTILSLHQEKEDLGHRLKIAINSKQSTEEECKRSIYELQQTINPMKQKYESQIKQLKFQNLQLQENYDSMSSEFELSKTQIANLLSIASDIYGEAFLNLQGLGEFLGSHEEDRKKEKIQYELQMQNEMQTLKDKIQMLKAKYHAQKDAAKESIKSLTDQISQIQEFNETPTIKTSDNTEKSSIRTPPPIEKSFSQVTTPEISNNIPQTPILPASEDSTFRRSETTERPTPSPTGSVNTNQNYVTPTTSEIFSSNRNEDNVSELQHQLENAQNMRNSLIDELAIERAKNMNLQHELEQTRASLEQTANLSYSKPISEANSTIKSENDEELRQLKEKLEETINKAKNSDNEYKKKLEEAKTQQESDKNEMKKQFSAEYNLLQEKFEEERKEFAKEKERMLEDIKNSKKYIEKQKKSTNDEISKLKKVIDDKQNKLKEAVGTIKTLQLKLKQAQAKIKKQVMFVNPINWSNLHLSQDFITELMPKINGPKMSDRDKLEIAIVMLVDRYRDKIQKIVDESVAKTNQMREQVRGLIGNQNSSDDEANINFGRLVEMIKSTIQHLNELKLDVGKVCSTLNIKNINDVVSTVQKLTNHNENYQKEIQSAKKTIEDSTSALQQKEILIQQITEQKSNEIDALNRNITKITEDLQQGRSQIENLNQNLLISNDKLEQCRNQNLEDQKTINKLELEKESLTNQLNDLKNQIINLNNELERQKSQINEERSKFDKERDALEQKYRTETANQMKSRDDSIHSLQLQIETVNNDLRKAQNDLVIQNKGSESLTSQLEIFRKYIEKLRRNRTKLKKKIKVLTQTLEDTKTEAKQNEEEMKIELDNMEKSMLTRIRFQTDEYKDSINKLQREVDRLQIENEGFKAQNTDLTLKLQKQEMSSKIQIAEVQRDKRQLESQVRAQILYANSNTVNTRVFTSVRSD